ncbi:MAG: DUF885 domain-containing protein [Gammaproteobacteria bacterium]|nr:DUF885 domain-containing protein [Gammaproteobacteria bacterium]MDH4315559.1 DUF885 domain-containing protein [Gammaproteobacteria bacterium]MDH5215296.1 DUF885 domain-containing protein [Gammaproteobacteria bacterium]MDH5500368.1 DUF885 domain-containing protein [Gammaproteobacteria bacterium]
MNRYLAAIAAALLLLSACGKTPEDEAAIAGIDTAMQPAEELKALVEEYFDRILELNPLFATQIGDDRFNDRLANSVSPEHRRKAQALDREFLERILAIDPEALAGQDRLTYDTFRWSREMDVAGYQFPDHLQPINQFYSITTTFVQLGSGTSVHPFKTVKDYDDFLSRIDDFTVIVDQSIENMRIGAEQGVVQPKILMEKVLPQLESQITDDVESSTFYTPVREMPADFSAEDRDRLTAAYRSAIANKVIPAYQRLHNFVGDDYMSATRESVGISELPSGEAWYAHLVQLRTTTEMTPAEIHQIGLDEVARIHDEMRKVRDEVGFDGDLQDFFEYLNTDDRFYFDKPEELIQGYRDMTERVKELTKKLFDVSPNTGFEVRAVEPFRERSASGGSYRRGTPDGSRPGVFFANTYDIKARPKWAMESLFLHEAIPGHYFQIEIQQELEGVPRFRRFGSYTAFSEGWGLYAESLGKELGMYTDPYQYFGALNAELWRAIRLVVDTGLHSKGWSRQDVLDYMYANSAVKEARAVSEAERYMAIPGQALAYKIGQLKIRELRTRAEQKLGDRFDVVSFHTLVLSEGAMPLTLLEQRVDRWIASQT